MVVNKVFEDPRGLNFVFCYTDETLPSDSIITVNNLTAYPSRVYNSANGWNPGMSSSNQGVIGFNYTGTGYAYGDTFNITNSQFTLPVSSYLPPPYGYLNFTADRNNGGAYYPGSSIYANQNYLNVGTGDFTIEFVVKVPTVNNFTTFVSFENPGYSLGVVFGIGYNSGNFCLINQNVDTYGVGGTLQADTWTHVAICRSSNVAYCYVDGVLKGSTPWNHDYSNITTLRFGCNDLYGNYGLTYIFGLQGALCNIRITANEALYNSDFSPPTLPLTAGPNTTVLMLANTEANEYVNSIDNFVFTNVNNPATNEPVSWTAGPIPYPPPPPAQPLVTWTPPEYISTYWYGWDQSGYNHSTDVQNFNFGVYPGSADFGLVYGLSFNYPNFVSSFSGLENLPNLQYLYAEGNSLYQFNGSFTPKLTNIYLQSTSLTSINLTSNYYLSSATINNSQLNSFNFANNNKLQYLNLNSSSNLTSLTLTALTGLSYIDVGYCSLTSLSISNPNKNFTLYAGGNQLTSIDLSSFNKAEVLAFGGMSTITSISMPVSTMFDGSYAQYVYTWGCSNLNSNFSLSGMTYIRNFVSHSCSFPESTVDRLFNEIYNGVLISGQTNGYASVIGGTSASPTAASLTARNYLLSMGWALEYN